MDSSDSAAGNSYISANNSRPNGFLVSKINQSEAVPLAYEYLLQAGTINIIIYRAIALQDAVYMFTNGGIFRITGSDPTALQTLLFDSSALLFGLNTPVVLNNSIYYASTQGICSVSSGGNQIMSRNIERDILLEETFPTFASAAFGCVYESDRRYLLWGPQADSQVKAYAYNWITASWTFWTRVCTAAIVGDSTNLLYIAHPTNRISQERKSFTNADFVDEVYPVNIVSINSGAMSITLTSSAEIQVGDLITQTTGLNTFTTQVLINTLLTNTITVGNVTGFVPGTATIDTSIMTEIQYTPIHCGFQEYVKAWDSWQFMFSNANFNAIRCAMGTDWVPGQEVVNLVPIVNGGWGTQLWGTFPWGVTTIPEQVLTTWPTRNTRYGHWVIINLQLSQAFTSLALDGLSCTFDIISTRAR